MPILKRMSGNMNYQSFAYSATGDSHLKQNRVCQDYSLHYQDDRIAIAAVADGHGSESHFRSDRGARFACESAIKCIKALCEKSSKASLSGIIISITDEWNRRVDTDWNNDTITEPNPLENPRRVYGTTLTAVAVTSSFWFGLQIGDGKCVVLDQNGLASQPIPWDEACYLNVTTSLCDSDAEQHFRYYHSREIPTAIFIGTDGVDNSYPVYENEKHLEKLYRTIMQNFAQEGFEVGAKELSEFLPLLTQKGSGDDVSIAGIINTEWKTWQRT